MHVSLPYEPGRAVYASLARTARDLAALAGDDIVPVALDLSRQNGCEIELWDRFAGIVPAASS